MRSDEQKCAEPQPGEMVLGCLTDEEIEKTVVLLQQVWPAGGFTFEYLKWLYCENPVGKAAVCNVWSQDQIIAHYAAIPIKAELFGTKEQGLLSLNTAVHPDHRGQGYFKTLANRTIEDASKGGATFVVGVANSISTTLFRRQLRFQLVCPLVTKIGLGSVRRVIASKAVVPDYVHCWDSGLIAWRVRRPNACYQIKQSRSGVVMYCNTRKYGIWAIVDDPALGQISVPANHKIRWNPLSIWIGLDMNVDWEKSMFFDIPERFKPSPLNLIFKDLTEQNRLLDPSKINFSLLDFDVY